MSLVLPLQSLRRISGFGRSEFYDGYVFKPQSPEEILGIFEVAREAERQVVLRAAGRSYGDPAVGRECVICDFTGMSTIHDFNPEFGFVEVDPGVTLETIWRTTLPQGWWLPVVSGTTKITVGGALAMNIHGKNNYVRGTLGEHVSQVDFLTTDGRLLKLGPDDPLFTSVFSTAGLLGAITRVKLQLKKVSSGNVHVKAISCANLQEQFETFERFEGDAEYCVSWVDCCARGRAKGRGLFHAGWHPEKPDAHSLQDQDLPEQIMGFFPKSKVWKILRWLNNRPGMRFVNAAKQTAGRVMEHDKEYEQSLAEFNFLLDYVPDWERAYAPGGLIQCQYFIPRDSAFAVFGALLGMQQAAGLESFLGVMKRHRRDPFLFSHAVDGYSLALDFKVTRRNREKLEKLTYEMNQTALKAGGRFYFAKDSTLTSAQAATFLGEALPRFRELKAELDPYNLLTSELAKRLELA